MQRQEPTEDEIFRIAHAIPATDARMAYLKQACRNDVEVERIVELLKEGSADASFLEKGPLNLETKLTEDLPVGVSLTGTMIGPYKLLQPIGEGGFGVVYMAEQTSPVRRKVALKVIKPGMDSKQVVARFEAERQALALMDHPNVARVFDGGSTESGHPYFVMELVKGVPITQFCDENKLNVHQRLELFVTVCRAIQHAHHKGVIHRDIKPSNILVTLHDGSPVPKVIDFGVSKAISQQLTDKTMFTAHGQMIGTAQYMSPEQAEISGLDIDTRSDIYSLGILLFELLTGDTPLDPRKIRETGYAELQRLIREQESPKPSTRLSTMGDYLTSIANKRSTDANRLGQFLRGDLDWIVMKAIEKERGRRYETASSFADDIERFLANEAVEARPPSIRYKVQKFAARNRGAVLAGTMIAATLLLGVVGTTVGMLRAKQEARNSSEMAEARKIALETARIERSKAVFARDKLDIQSYFQQIGLAQVAIQKGRPADALELLRECPDSLKRWEWHYLNRLACSDQLESLHVGDLPGAVQVAAWSPTDPDLAVVLTDEGSLTLISVEGDRCKSRHLCKTKAQIIEKVTEQNPNYNIWFTPTGEEIAVPVGEAGYELVDIQDGHRTGKIAGRDDFVTLDFHPILGKKRTATGSRDGTIRLWDADGNQLDLQEMRHEKSWVKDIEFSQDGKFIASGDFEGTAHIWSAETGECLQTIGAHAPPVNVLALSANGEHLVTASYDHRVILWDVATGEKLRVFDEHTDSVFGVAFCDNDRRVASSSFDGTVRIWQVDSDQEVLMIEQITTNFGKVAVNSTGSRLLAATNSDSLTIWDGTPNATRKLPQLTIDQGGRVFDIEFFPSGHQILVSGERGVRVFDIRSGKEVYFDSPVAQMAFNATLFPHQQYFAASHPLDSFNQFLVGPVIFDRKSGEVVQRPHPSDQERLGHSVAISRDGRWLANGGSRQARLWDLNTPLDQQESRLLGQMEEPAWDVEFSPCGRYLAIRLDEALHIWNVHQLEDSLESRILPSELASEFAFSPNGEWVAMALTDGSLIIASTKIDNPLDRQSWKVSEVDIICLAYHPNGRFLATSGSDETIRIWNVETRELVQVFVEDAKVFCVAFSPDGQSLVSGTHSMHVRVWDTSFLND